MSSSPRLIETRKQPWKVVQGKTTFFNVPPAYRFVDVLEEMPMELRRYRNAFVSRREVVNSENGVKFESMAQWYSRGAVYDESGLMIPGFERVAELQPQKFDNPRQIKRQRIHAAEEVSETCLYLGVLHGHFGHFLVESLARAWGMLRVDGQTRVLFHYANASSGDIERLEFPSFVATVLEVLGIDRQRLVLANRDLRVKDLIVPDAQFWIGDVGSHNMCVIYDHIREEIVRRKPALASGPRRIYLTRRLLNETAPHKIRKSASNEHEVEDLFVARGFESVALERMPFDQQIAVIGGATHIAGTTGSALHMILFNGRLDAQLFAIDTRNSKTQYILDAAREITSSHIFCYNGRDSNGAILINVPIVSRALEDLMPEKRAEGVPGHIAEWTRQQHVGEEEGAVRQPGRGEPAGELAAEAGLRLFSDYHRLKLERVALAPTSAALWAFLNAVQGALAVKGDFLEIGVGAGGSALFALLMLGPREEVILVDQRRHPVFEQNLKKFDSDVQQRMTFFEVRSDALDEEALRFRKFRWMHIDADASHAGVSHDLEHFSGFMQEDGLLVLDNFFEASAPDVTTSVYEFLQTQKEWRVLLLAFSKVYLVRSDAKAKYMALLDASLKAFLGNFGNFALSSRVQFTGDTIWCAKGNVQKALELAKKTCQ